MPTSTAPRRKAGRPPRISRAMIAQAAHELGLEGLTLKAVADHLGVSVAALYHHVSGKDDLHARRRRGVDTRDPAACRSRAALGAMAARLGELQPSRLHRPARACSAGTSKGSSRPRRCCTISSRSWRSSCATGSRSKGRMRRTSSWFPVHSAPSSVNGGSGRRQMAIVMWRRDIAASSKRTPTRQLTHVRSLFSSKAPRPTFEDRIETVLRGIAAVHGLRLRPLVHATATQSG